MVYDSEASASSCCRAVLPNLARLGPVLKSKQIPCAFMSFSWCWCCSQNSTATQNSWKLLNRLKILKTLVNSSDGIIMLFDTGVRAMSIYSLVLTWPLRHIHDITTIPTALHWLDLTQYWVGLLQSLTGWLNIFLKPLHHHSCPKLLSSQFQSW